MELVLYREYFTEGVNGTLLLDGKFICNTIELPWRENKIGESCITEGEYNLRVRFSKKYGYHIHILGVYDRKWILFHPANDALKELRGCIAPVSKLTGEGKGINSRKAMDILMINIKSLKQKNEKSRLSDGQVKLIIKKKKL